MTHKLTVLIPCKDERKNIRDCIESARKVADEILIADSMSTDNTLDIVRDAGGCRIIEREFVNYSDFKNWAIPQAQHAWVLIVDADERISDSLAGEIRRVLADPPGGLDGYWIGRDNFFMGHQIRHCGWNCDAVFRLIRRDECRYQDVRVHEEIYVDPARAGKLRENFQHYSFWSYDQYFAKQLRYTKWGALDRWERGKRTGFTGLLLRPMFRFLQLYFLRLGFLDGLPGLQICMLTAFFNTFVKQARLWELEYAMSQPNPDPAADEKPVVPTDEAKPRAAA